MENRKYLAKDLLGLPLYVKLQNGYSDADFSDIPVRVFSCYEAALKHLSSDTTGEFDTMVFMEGNVWWHPAALLLEERSELLVIPTRVAKVVKLEDIIDLQDILVKSKD